jgi:endoglycosylceramidase
MGRFYREALASLNRYSSGWAGYVWCYGGGYCAVDVEGRFRTNKEQTAAPYAPAVAGKVTAEGYEPDSGTYRLEYRAARGVSEISVPPSVSGWRIEVTGPARPRARTVPPGRTATVRVHARPGERVTVGVSPRTPR